MTVPVYCGLGSKSEIMKYFYNKISNISGVRFVDYQRSYAASSNPENTPGVFINDIIETRERITADIIKNTLTIGVVAWTRAGVVAKTEENLWDKMNTFADAINQAILSDPTLGNQAYQTSVTRVETDAGSRYPIGLFVIVYSVIYFSEGATCC
jgi:hypothetical protein